MTWGSVELLLIIMAVAVVLTVGAAIHSAGRARGSRAQATTERGAFTQAFEDELERARRHERPLALVRIGSDRPSPGVRQDGVPPLAEMTRRTDRVFVIGRSIYVLAPETDVVASRRFVARLYGLLHGDAMATVQAACFPADGLTSGALLARLHEGGRVRDAHASTPRRIA